MKPHPRIRRSVKWAGAVVSVVLVGVWEMSATNWVSYIGTTGRGVVVGEWQVSIYTEETLQFPPQFIGWRRNAMSAGTGVWADAARTRLIWPVRLPIWPAVGISLLVTAAAWRLDTLTRRRLRIGCCPKCGYDRAGLPPASPCPECDAPRPAAAPPGAKD